MTELETLLERLVSAVEKFASEGQSWSDWVEPAASVVSALAAVAAAWFAIRGIHAWRSEAVGKQRAEVATQTLASFYKLRDVFAAARSPIVWAGEMVPAAGEDSEFGSASETAPIRRLRAHQDFLAEFQSQKYLFGAVFGREYFALFDGIVRLHNEVVAASQALFENRDNQEIRDTYYPIAFQKSADDGIATRLEVFIGKAEAVCAPAIQASAKRLR